MGKDIITQKQKATEEIQKSKFANPLLDYAFKRLFGTDSVKKHLISFLNSVFKDKEIKDLTYISNEVRNLEASKKNVIFDIVCKSDNDEFYIVEMQRNYHKHLAKRLLYYMSLKVMEQIEKGATEYELQPVHVVCILDYKSKYAAENLEANVQNAFATRHEREFNRLYESDFNLIELPRFEKGVQDLKTDLDKWVYVLKNIASLKEIPTELDEEVFRSFFTEAEIATYNNEELNYLIESLMSVWDERGYIEGALEIGEQRGLAKGVDKGRMETLLSTAKNMLKLGSDDEFILAATNISEEQLKELKESFKS